MKDLYSSLGVPKDADPAQIKKAYREATRKYHPDKNPGDKAAEEKFKEVSQAYEVLGDKEKRSLYDEFGEVSLTQGFDPERARAYSRARGGGGAGGFGGGGFGNFGDFGDARATSFDDLLSNLFGGGGRVEFGDGFGRPAGPRKGRDISGEISVEFDAALHGTTVPLRIDGAGGGRSLDVKVPQGIKDGAKLRLRGQGGAGQPNGDILLTVRVKSSKRWDRSGDDLKTKAPLPALTAYKGGPVDVETPWGTVTVKVPAGSQSGQTLRLRGKGVHYASEKRKNGDLLVTLEIVMPPPGDAELLQALERLQGDSTSRADAAKQRADGATEPA